LGDSPDVAALFFEKIMDELQDKSVLVVDDDPGMLRAMTKVLANEGMQVTGVSDPVAVAKRLADSEKRFTWSSLTCGCRCSVDAGFWR